MSTRTLQVLRDEHHALAAVLRSMQLMMAHGPADAPGRFFDVTTSGTRASSRASC